MFMTHQYSTDSFEKQYSYAGTDLGAVWSREKTVFRVWAPTASQVRVNLYQSGTQGADDLIEQIPMAPHTKGTWVAEKAGDLNGVYYTYLVQVAGQTLDACDPYARATGVNGNRAMVIDLKSTDPEGWDADRDPHAGKPITDAVIYELHLRDLSMDPDSGIENKGKYLALTETGTKNAKGISTGLDHIKALGVTHVQLLPVYDYGSVDESKLQDPQFNWGYDPVNYNVPEGSYATDPFNGAVRIREFKQMVKSLHDNGISLVMDVVYNHVYNWEAFCFNRIVPGYFSRIRPDGTPSNGSGCGNDTASERSMVRKYIVESVLYWAREYHIDGFRFDLVGLMDTDTINAVVAAVHKTHPNVIFYGEGWDMGTFTTKPGLTMTCQNHSQITPGFAFFNDTIRDALKGSVFSDRDKGYVSGADPDGATIEACFKGMPHWCGSPTQSVNYVSCHDNLTIFDKLALSNKDDSLQDRIRMNKLAAAFYMTSQGIPLFQAGEEMLRSKPLRAGRFDHNSYRSSDKVNSLKWSKLSRPSYQAVYAYYKGLIAFRKAHPALRMTDPRQVCRCIDFVYAPGNVAAFHIRADQELFLIFNPHKTPVTVSLPEGRWTVYINGEQAGTTPLSTAKGQVTPAPISALIMVKQ